MKNSLEHADRIRTLIVGGAPVSNALQHKVRNQDNRIFETYGMTETITHIAAKRLSRADSDSNSGATDTAFKALPGIRFSKDERDCLIIEAPKVSDAKVVTNDLVHLISQTEFTWMGRYDNIINSGGVKFVPEQIEYKLAPFTVPRFFVAGLPDPDLGQKVVLVLEGETDTDQILQKIIASNTLDTYEVPKEIYTVPKFVETDNGKVRRKETLKLLAR